MIRLLGAELIALTLVGCGGNLERDGASARFTIVHATSEREDFVVPSNGVDCSVASGGLRVDLHPSLSPYPRLWLTAKPYPGPTEYQLGAPDPKVSESCLGDACWKLAWAPSEGVFYSQQKDAGGCTLELERYASPHAAFSCQMSSNLAVVDGEFACGDDLATHE